MKMYPQPKLPLKPQGFFERYLLYTFESRERWLVVQALLFLLMLGMWAMTRSWVFGIVALFSLIHVYLGLEARAVGRMIRRASSCGN